MFKWFKTLRKIVEHYKKDIDIMRTNIEANRIKNINTHKLAQASRNTAVECVNIIKSRTDAHMDIHQVKDSQVILVGRHRGNDYVQAYTIEDDTFEAMIHHLRELEKYAAVRRLDVPLQFKGVIEHDFLSRGCERP